MDKDYSEDYLYNKSLSSAYRDLLMKQMGRQNNSMAVEGDGSEGDLEDMSNYEEYDVGLDQRNKDDNDPEDDSEYYRKFKKSLVLDDDEGVSEMDDAWLDDNSTVDGDYTDEADRSFYDGDHQTEEGVDNDDDDDDDEDDEDLEDDEEEYLEDEEEHMANRYSIRRLICWITLGMVLFFASPLASSGLKLLGSSTTPIAGTPTGTTSLQRQINHLYNELDHRDDRYKSDFDKTIKVVISQFEKNIKKLLPSNFNYLQTQLESLTNRVNNISIALSRSVYPQFSMDNVTEWQQQLVRELEAQLPQEIPVVVDNTSSVLVIPELHNYLTRLTSSLIENSHPLEQPLEYDLSLYVKEILANQFQYVDKDFFIKELNRKLQLNKQEIWQEMAGKFDQWKMENNPNNGVPQQYSTILLKKLINQIYNSNQHQWEDDLDFATFSQGTKLLNHLTSSTLKQGNGVNPMELLQESKYGPSTYWQCASPKGCSWAIRFKEPVYLTRLFYSHGRFRNNLQMMNSAPKTISVYVRLATGDASKKLLGLASSFKMGTRFAGDNQHILIGQYNYRLTDNRIRQPLPLPTWFIQLKPLVRSVVFQVDENHGNKQFTSLRKFIVNAVTQQDLQIMESNAFPLISNDPEYASSSTSAPQIEDKPRVAIAHDNDQGIPSFGQDELDE
ncbi:ZYRO0G12298p [Zygosaccharomyces rouxii]|uniref:ZYRO0G12298p n=1 Tax=Zygosaccharomyces rouxii (strain ATCC 2623 / CBS 732 / NBRC 1130 / NCYC 568 / NRRL Y-229) TaxID=559307 RepID=C5E0F5_ZYGRC|nr:uncharacterized protein ZYRO0G12298g [Zygosaccharomyces rouxii]KAH9202582.1 hypothetical protein LQ764DRAFT_212099 [Zygosaccharomyces rouxii]CAR29589.1 ZYRO0G12298p [Zygosaccharomyces rouxii]